MAKAQKYSKPAPKGEKVMQRDLKGMKTAESLVPTPAAAVNLHKRMAGVC